MIKKSNKYCLSIIFAIFFAFFGIVSTNIILFNSPVQANSDHCEFCNEDCEHEHNEEDLLSSLYSNGQSLNIVNSKNNVSLDIEYSPDEIMQGKRNVFFFKFKDDDSTDYFSNDLYTGNFNTLIENMNNSEDEKSLKNFYKTMSNGMLDVSSEIVTKNSNEDVEFHELDINRTFAMPYYYRDSNQKGRKNNEGYYDFELIDTRTVANNLLYKMAYNLGTIDYQSLSYIYYFTLGTTTNASAPNPLISHVYDCNKYDPATGVSKHDMDTSDGVCCKCYATQLANGNSNYFLINSADSDVRRSYILGSLLNNCQAKLSESYQDNMNEDGEYDALIYYCNSNIAAGSDYRTGWNDLLWPHNWSMMGMTSIYAQASSMLRGFGLTLNDNMLRTGISSFGYDNEIQNDIFKYSFNMDEQSFGPANLKAGLYNLLDIGDWGSNLSTASDYANARNSFSVEAHEFGHLLGLPDYYYYKGESELYGQHDAVSSWNLMSGNTYPTPQYVTSYDRYSLGWLSDSETDTTPNIVDMQYNKIYRLSPVTCNDEDEIVAYRIKGTGDYVGQDIYFEYRSKTASQYDTKIPASGLIIYRVKPGVTDGNRTAYPHGMYMYGISSDPSTAALDIVGETFDDEITWENSGGVTTPVGMTVILKSISEDEVSFSVQYSGLSDNIIYSASDFENINTYNKLYQLSTSLGHEDLNKLSFQNVTSLDLSGLELSNLDVLEMFDFDAIQYINLTSNNLTNDCMSSLSQFVANNSTVLKISLVDNIFTLSTIENNIKSNIKYIFGIQKTDAIKKYYCNEQPTIYYYWNSVDTASFVFTIMKNSTTNISANADSQNGHTFSSIGKYTVSITGQQSTAFAGITLSYTFTYCTVSLKQVVKEFERSSISAVVIPGDCVNYNGLNDVSFSSSMTIPLDTVVNDGQFIISVFSGTDRVIDLIQYYKVIDKKGPSITFYTDATKTQITTKKEYYIEIESVYTLLNCTARDSLGNEISYNINYYTATKTASGYSYNVADVVPGISTHEKAHFVAVYSATDSGITNTSEIYYTITARIIAKSNFADENLYNALTENGTKDLPEDTYENTDYLDLSNKNISSINGLANLMFKNTVKIDLSKNNLTDDDSGDITSFLSSKNIGVIFLMFNNFSILQNNNTKLVYGMQKMGDKDYYINYNFGINHVETPENHLVNDYETYFSLITTQNESSYNGVLYGSYLYTFTGKFGSSVMYSSQLYYGYIKCDELVNTQEILSTFVPSEVDFICLNKNDFVVEISPSANDVNNATLSPQQIIYTIKFKNNLASQVVSFTQTVSFVDTQAPEIELKNDNDAIYVINNKNYSFIKQGSVFEDESCEISDNFTSKNNLVLRLTYTYQATESSTQTSVNAVNTNVTGYYEITYTVTDPASQKSAYVKKTVVVGNVNYMEIRNANFGDLLQPRFTFAIFDENDFTIVYKYTNELETTYRSIPTNGIKLDTKTGETSLDFKLTNRNIIYNFTTRINVVDNIAPTIVLLGDGENIYEIIHLRAGENYIEYGCKAWDNITTEEITTLSGVGTTSDGKLVVSKHIYYQIDGEKEYVSNVETDEIRTYYIDYIANDGSKTASKTRTIVITYPLVNAVDINTSTFSNESKVGENIRFVAYSKFLTGNNNFESSEVEYLWYVNGNLQSGEKSYVFETSFDYTGTYQITACAVNKNYDNTSTVCTSNAYTVLITRETLLDKYGLYFLGGISSIIVLFVVILIIGKYRRARFY